MKLFHLDRVDGKKILINFYKKNRNRAKIEFEKYFYKLRNNFAFRKMLEKFRIRIKIENM